MNSKKMKIAAALLALGMSAAACSSDSDTETVEDDTSSSIDQTTDDAVADDAVADDAAADDAAADDATADDAMADDAAPDDATADDTATDDGALPESVVAIAQASPDHTVLVEAVIAADLATTLSGPGPYTVFAPTDEAFVAALEALDMTKEELLADTELLSSVLTFHVVPASALAADLTDGQVLSTVNGEELTVSIEGDAVKVNDATVTVADLEAANGVVHVIDTVLVPAPAE